MRHNPGSTLNLQPLMTNNGSSKPLKLFSTCPQSSAVQADSYVRRVADVARWSEQCGCKGILVYADNSLVDAWLVSQIIMDIPPDQEELQHIGIVFDLASRMQTEEGVRR